MKRYNAQNQTTYDDETMEGLRFLVEDKTGKKVSIAELVKTASMYSDSLAPDEKHISDSLMYVFKGLLNNFTESEKLKIVFFMGKFFANRDIKVKTAEVSQK